MKNVLFAGGVVLSSWSPAGGEQVDSCTTGTCEVCHASRTTVVVQATAGQPASNAESVNLMLRGSDASSTCLLCHESPAGILQPQGHYVATSQNLLRALAVPGQLPPGGDFGWLRRNYAWSGESGRMESRGERHGHNIVALDFNYDVDATLRVAPGGTYPANALSCTSCHDPHGSYRRSADGTISATGLPVIASGSYATSPNPDGTGTVGTYRMLAGKGYQPKSLSVAAPFVADPPAAVSPVSYNRSESATDTRVAYGSGMSEWCRNCHAQIHDEGDKGGGHPAGNGANLTFKTALIYNSYLRSGDLTGTAGSAYTSMVPFEMGTNDYAVLKATANSDGSNLKGPDMDAGAPNVMCLSCHRAHASGWDSMMRWNMNSTLIVVDSRYPGIDTGAAAEYAQGRTEAEVRKTFYDRPANRYASYQRSLCNKCHGKD